MIELVGFIVQAEVDKFIGKYKTGLAIIQAHDDTVLETKNAACAVYIRVNAESFEITCECIYIFYCIRLIIQ
jgi:hypothetical protein